MLACICSGASRAKTAELIEMPFGTQVGPRNHVLDGSPDPLENGQFERGEGAAHCKVQGLSAMSCAKMAEPIKMPFQGMDLGWPKEACVRLGVHIGGT